MSTPPRVEVRALRVELSARQHQAVPSLTVDGQVAQSCARGALHLDVVRLKEEHDRFEGISPDLSHISVDSRAV